MRIILRDTTEGNSPVLYIIIKVGVKCFMFIVFECSSSIC